jgi:hypothetical protein
MKHDKDEFPIVECFREGVHLVLAKPGGSFPGLKVIRFQGRGVSLLMNFFRVSFFSFCEIWDIIWDISEIIDGSG